MMQYLLAIMYLNFSPSIKDAKREYIKHVRSEITCNVNFSTNGNFQIESSTIYKEITISVGYWIKLDYTARKVAVLRELIHCETGHPYMNGVSLMNKKITQAVAAYEYGAK